MLTNTDPYPELKDHHLDPDRAGAFAVRAVWHAEQAAAELHEITSDASDRMFTDDWEAWIKATDVMSTTAAAHAAVGQVYATLALNATTRRAGAR